MPLASPEPPGDPNDKTWEDRAKTIAGRYEADRKKSRETLDQMAQRITQLETELRTQPQPTRQPQPQQPNLSPQEMEDYGPDFVNMIQRIATHTVQGYVGPLAEQVGRTQAKVEIQENQSMHEQMSALYPDWQRLNQYQPFIDWVMLPDPYSGGIRQKLMQDAWDRGDARRVLAFFQGFLSEEAALNPAGAVSPPARAPIAPNGGAPAAAPPLTLQQLAAPGGARSASLMPAEKPTYTTEDITRFYTECAQGKWRHREQDRAAIDADIHRAQHEGRILLANRRYTPPSPPQGFSR
jgi:hypothetical protein